jgi:proline racemase
MAAVTSIRTVDMHTAGEPVRIVVDGYPEVPGDTILAKRRHAREHLDHLRRLLMFEPRGHADMYGVIPVAPDHPDADLAVLFMHTEGYSTMCGHAAIALGRWAVDTGLVAATEPTTRIALQVPSGLLRMTVDVAGGAAGEVRFESVPAFVASDNLAVAVPAFGEVTLDIAFGGAFYAVADAASYGLDVRESTVRDLVAAAWATTRAVAESGVAVEHPDDADLGFLYGTILTDAVDDGSGPSANICVFAGRQVDRSPTGSGITARIAIQRSRRLIEPGETRVFESVIGSRFTGRLLTDTRVAGRDAVTVEVGGRAHYVGEATFTLEDDDPFPSFLLKE